MTLLWPDDWTDTELYAACEDFARSRGLAFLKLGERFTFRAWVEQGGRTSSLSSGAVLLLDPGPLDPMSLLDTRETLSEADPPVQFRILRLPGQPVASGWAEWLEEKLGDFGLRPPEEEVGLLVGSHVRVPEPSSSGSERGYEPYVLTVPPDGPLAPVLSRLDSIRRTFQPMLPADLGDARRRVHGALDSMLSDPTPAHRKALHEAVERSKLAACDRSQLPRLLLLGESGTGKTVLARYLAEHQTEEVPFDRVPVPEYLGREDHFESDVFGYCKGAHTDARDEGSRGTLGELIGGVVFFDEIGDASPTVQAKLLAYLDDYVVKPRGLAGRGYYCPTLVIAATNRDVFGEREAGGGGMLRSDLLNRFNEVVRVPSLTDRSNEIDLQVDLILQQEAAGSAAASSQPIHRVGVHAMERLRALDFTGKNFRLLERVLSSACKRARAQRRDYLIADDITENDA